MDIRRKMPKQHSKTIQGQDGERIWYTKFTHKYRCKYGKWTTNKPKSAVFKKIIGYYQVGFIPGRCNGFNIKKSTNYLFFFRCDNILYFWRKMSIHLGAACWSMTWGTYGSHIHRERK